MFSILFTTNASWLRLPAAAKRVARTKAFDRSGFSGEMKWWDGVVRNAHSCGNWDRL